MRSVFRIGGAILLGAMIVSGAFFARQNNGTQQVQAGVDVVTIESTERLQTYQETKDTDGDGLSDWQEELIGTDKVVPNTESDVFPEKPEEAEQVSPSESTFTQQFARSFFENSVRAKYNDDSFGSYTQDQVVNDALLFVSEAVQPTTYTRADITLSSKSSIDALRDYGNDAGAVLLTHQVPPGDTPIDIMTRALDTNDSEELQKLHWYVVAFDGIRNDLLKMTVPQTLANEHLNLLNTTSIMHASLEAIKNTYTDPIVAIGYIQQYWESLGAFTESMIAIKVRLERENIFYENNEPGIFFFSI